MTQTLQLIELDPHNYDELEKLAAKNPFSGFMQSRDWAKFKELEGYHVTTVGFLSDGQLIGGALLYYYPYGQQSGFVICPEGPILDWNDSALIRSALRALQSHCQALTDKFKCVGLRIEPHLPYPCPSALKNWSKSPVVLSPEQTLVLNIDQTEEQLLINMKPKGRYNLKICQKSGVVIRKSVDLEDIEPFYELLYHTSVRNDFFCEPIGYFLNLGSVLLKSGNASLYFAEYDGEVLSAILVVFFGMRASYLYGGSSTSHRNLMPNYGLQWRAMLDAKARGCKEYDMFGYEPDGVPDHLYAGISRFKRQFGGRFVENIGARDYIFYDNMADEMLSHLNK